MKSIKVSRRRSRSKKRILLEKEEEVTKCLVIGSSNSSVSKFIKSFQKGSESYLPANEASFRWNQTDFMLWRGNDQTGLKKALLKQYLVYHGAQVLFYLVNDRDIEVRCLQPVHFQANLCQESILEVSDLINLCIAGY